MLAAAATGKRPERRCHAAYWHLAFAREQEGMSAFGITTDMFPQANDVAF
jgi:hypothetical protein